MRFPRGAARGQHKPSETMSNILNKDDSQWEGRHFNAKYKKQEKYKWKAPGPQGEFRLIPKKKLNIDGDYQRDQVSVDKVLRIAREWDWRLFGVLAVVEREDLTLWVYDGGHRCRGAFRRDDIDELPCMVFKLSDKALEAEAFVGTNTMKTGVSAFHLHRARKQFKDPVAVKVAAIVDKYGYRVVQEEQKFGFRAVHTLEKMVKRDEVLAERVFAACTKIALDGEQIPQRVMGALFECQCKLEGRADILSGDYLEKLVAKTLSGIKREIESMIARVQKGGPLVAALGVLEVINKGKHRKLSFS